jgi:ligand-binding SRPBCC domain-containing protein
MSHHLEFEQWVPFPAERVFAFFSNPENLPLIMPAASGTKIIGLNRAAAPSPPAGLSSEKTAGVGTTFVTSFRVLPFLPLRRQWIARITEFEWNHHFTDVQDKGPFQLWNHRHEFERVVRQNVEGTLIRDVINYEIGFGFIGSIANAAFVRRQMERTFAERQRKLPDLLGG